MAAGSNAGKQGRRIGRKSGRGAGSSRTLYETYIKKLHDSYFNDVKVKLQSGDIDIGSDSFIKYATKGPAEVKKRTVYTWGIAPTRIALSGVGDFNGSYVLRELTNKLSRSGGFQSTVGLVTTDEFLQKGSRLTRSILDSLGVGFTDRYMSKFVYHTEKAINVRNIDISYNIGKEKDNKEGTESSGFMVLSPDAKADDNVGNRMTRELRVTYGFTGSVGSDIFSRGYDDLSVAYNAMNKNVLTHALDTWQDYLKDEQATRDAEAESEG